MSYFLDFDRTLFDTDAYYPYLLTKSLPEDITEDLKRTLQERRDQTLTGGTERIAVWDRISDLIRSGQLTFVAAELEHFLYPDVLPYLKEAGKEVVILTFGERERQRSKIESALAEAMPLPVIYIENETKANYFFRTGMEPETGSLLVDDRAAELEAMVAAFPLMRCYEMRRDGMAGDGRWPVIHSLTELP